MAFDVSKVREDFPILKSGVIYFDNSASSFTPEPVIRKMDEYYREYRANIHRGAHRLTKRASEEYEAVYGKLAKFFNAPHDRFVDVKNASEGINLVALGLGFKPDENVVTTSVEHHSNLLPWVRLERRKQIAGVRIVEPSDREGHFDLEKFKEKIDSKTTRLVAFTGASNVLSYRMPVKELAKVAHDAGALVLVDGAQMAGHWEVDLEDLGVDFFAFSGHKCLAPTGTGALYVREGVQLDSPFVGGGTISDAQLHDYKLLPLPEGMEAGTPNIAGFIGLGAALDYLTALGLDNVVAQEHKVVKKIIDGFQSLGIDWYGPRKLQERGNVVAFNIPGMDAHQVAMMVDELAKVCIRSGHHCALPLSRTLGIKASARASVHAFNTEEEAEKFIEALGKIKKLS